jgi:hypothetical protein
MTRTPTYLLDDPEYVESSLSTDADNLLAAIENEDAEDLSYMDQIDKRLEVTSFYRVLMQGNLFDQVTEASQIVEKDIKKYIRKKLEVLVGISRSEPTPAAVVLPFSEEQVTALKMLADKLLVAGKVTQQEPSEPSVRQAVAPAPPPAPSIRKRQTPKAPVAAAKPVLPAAAVPKAPAAPPQRTQPPEPPPVRTPEQLANLEPMPATVAPSPPLEAQPPKAPTKNRRQKGGRAWPTSREGLEALSLQAAQEALSSTERKLLDQAGPDSYRTESGDVLSDMGR